MPPSENASAKFIRDVDCTLLIGGTGLEIWHTGQQLFCEGKHTGQQLFFQNVYGTRTFLTETENCSARGSWCLYLSGENDILLAILLRHRFYGTVVVSRCG